MSRGAGKLAFGAALAAGILPPPGPPKTERRWFCLRCGRGAKTGPGRCSHCGEGKLAVEEANQ